MRRDRPVPRVPAGIVEDMHYYPSRDHRGSSSPPDDWYSNRNSNTAISRRTGPVDYHEAGPGRPAVANSSPSRTLYRGTSWTRGADYIRTGAAEHIATESAGDFHVRTQASYWTTSERYADYWAQRAARHDGRGGMVLQQRIPSSELNRAHCFPERPEHDWYETVYHGRAQLRPPREPEAVGRSQHTPHTVGPTSGRQTAALLRGVQRHRSGPEFEAQFHPEREQSSSDDSGVDQHRRSPRYVQQVRIQNEGHESMLNSRRDGRPNRPPRRR